jgi:DNA-binding CsgD family transcriptional regulator
MQRALDLEREQLAEGVLLSWSRTASVHFAEQLIELGEFDAARPVLLDVCDACRDYGVQMLAWPLGKLAALEQRAGNFNDALNRAEEAVEFATEVGDTGIDYCRSVKAYVHAACGETSAARLELDQARRHTQPNPPPPFVERVAGFVELSSGDISAAHELLARATDGSLTSMDRALSLPDQIEASVAMGALERAAAELTELEAVARQLDRPLVHAAAARSRGMVADAAGRFADSLQAFRDALEWHARVDQSFEETRTLLAYGVALRRARRSGEAREALARASRLLEEAGARPWAERARAELGRLGGRPPQTRGLTPTERQIAELVAAGRTNAEVARALHISPKTVEWNLSKVYKKVRVTSRAELAATFAKRPA